jgi:hypothetical protein
MMLHGFNNATKFPVDTACGSRVFTGPDETRLSPHVHRSRRVPEACAFKISNIFG